MHGTSKDSKYFLLWQLGTPASLGAAVLPQHANTPYTVQAESTVQASEHFSSSYPTLYYSQT